MFLSFQILNKNFLFKAKYIFLIISLFHVYVNSTLAMLSEQIIITPRAPSHHVSRLTCLLVPGRVLYQLALAAATRADTRGLHVAPRARDHRRSGYRVPGHSKCCHFYYYASPFHSLYGSHNAMKRHDLDIVFSLSNPFHVCYLRGRSQGTFFSK